jgi:hypothetical protein
LYKTYRFIALSQLADFGEVPIWVDSVIDASGLAVFWIREHQKLGINILK